MISNTVEGVIGFELASFVLKQSTTRFRWKTLKLKSFLCKVPFFRALCAFHLRYAHDPNISIKTYEEGIQSWFLSVARSTA